MGKNNRNAYLIEKNNRNAYLIEENNRNAYLIEENQPKRILNGRKPTETHT